MRRNRYRASSRLAIWLGLTLAVVLGIVIFMHLRSPIDAFGLPIGGMATLLRIIAVASLAFAIWMVLGKKESTAPAIATALLAIVIGALGLIVIEGLVWIIRIVLP